MVKLKTEACEFSEHCGFYHKFNQKNSMAWRGLFDSYCRGGLVQHCERYKLYRAEDCSCNDDVMPNGKAVPSAFKMLL